MPHSTDLDSETQIQIVPATSAIQDFQDFLTASYEQSSHDSHFSSLTSSLHNVSGQDNNSQKTSSDDSEKSRISNQDSNSQKTNSDNSEKSRISEQNIPNKPNVGPSPGPSSNKDLLLQKQGNSLEFSGVSQHSVSASNSSVFYLAKYKNGKFFASNCRQTDVGLEIVF